jgi:peptidoglycan/LPS O-acetylase OafA/YrhL
MITNPNKGLSSLTLPQREEDIPMTKNQRKFGAIHGLRGVAAMSVVLYHLSGNLKNELETLPEIILSIFSYGYLGVPIFFVISGFVISYGIGSDKVTAKYAGNFILRRSIRIDLTYWASIFMALLLLTFKNMILETQEETPSFLSIVLHMFYLQDLLNVDPVISVVYWTLCLEIQFYLFYILSVWVSQKYLPHQFATILLLLMIIPLGIYSITLDLGFNENPATGLFISNWHYFLMGILVSQAVRRKAYSTCILFAWLIIEVVFQMGMEVKPYALAGIATTLSIFLMWKLNALNTLFTGKPLTYLGTISYTLYLVHPDIGWKVISFGKLLLGNDITLLGGVILLITGIVSSILVAHIFHLLFEKPTLKIAGRLKSESLGDIFKSLTRHKF